MRGTLGILYSFPNFHSGSIDASGTVRSIRWESPPCAGRNFAFFILARGASALNVAAILYHHEAGVTIFESETLRHILIEEHILTQDPKEPEPMAKDETTPTALQVVDDELRAVGVERDARRKAAEAASCFEEETQAHLDALVRIRAALVKE